MITKIISIKPSEVLNYGNFPQLFYTEYSPFPLFCKLVDHNNGKFIYLAVKTNLSLMKLFKAKQIGARDMFFSGASRNFVIHTDISFDVEKCTEYYASEVPAEYMPSENLYHAS